MAAGFSAFLIGAAGLGMIILVLPTILYIAGIPFLLRLARRQGSPLVAILLVAAYILLPAASWFHARDNADAASREARARVAAIPVSHIDGDIPKFIGVRGNFVLRSGNLGSLSCPRPRPKTGNGITYLLTPEQLQEIQRKQRLREVAEARQPLLRRYLILEPDDKPPYPTRDRPAAGGETKRLYLHDNSRDTLIGVHFIPFVRRPTDVPVLTLSGWYGQPNVINAANDHLAAFLRSALQVKCIDLKVIDL